MRNPLVDDAITDLRARAGTVSLAKKTAAKAALRALRAAPIVAIPADQNQTRRYGVFVDLFGLPASTTPGPARLAMLSRRAGRAGVPGARGRVRPASHRRPARDRAGATRPIARPTSSPTPSAATPSIEEMLRRYPDQWIWFHKRWKTRPIGEARIY